MKPLKKFFNSGKTLAWIKQNLTEQEAILNQLRPLLPPPMGEHCVRAIAKKGDLILLVDSPAWASRLRYLSQNLTQQLRQKGLAVRRIQVKVTIASSRKLHREGMRRANPLSPSNAKLLSSVAECVGDDALRSALLRLSQHEGK